MPSDNGPTADDWPDERHLHDEPSTSGHHRNNRRAHYHEKGLNTGVRIMVASLCSDDGRLDIKFRDRKPWVAKILEHLQSQPPELEKGQNDFCMYEGGPEGVEHKSPLKLNIVVQVVGSRGDVQPFIALGKVLKSHGHRVRLATHLAFHEVIEDEGLEFFNIGGDPAELMAFMVKNPGLMPHMSTIRSGAIRRRRRDMKAIFSGCWRSCWETGDGTGLHHIPDDPWSETEDYRTKPFVADAIIANPPSFAHLSCAEKLGIPLNMMFTMPWSATQAFPHPLATVRSQNTKPSAANFASYAIVEIMMWEGLGDLINKFRKRELGLDPLDAIRAPSIAHQLQVPYTYLWSPALLPKPSDWGENIDVVGFSFLSSGSDYKPPDDLASFLKAGPPPIYIGFGSIVVDNQRSLTKIVFEAIKASGQRAIVNKGWGNIGADEKDIPDNILMISKAPHDWLFQHVSCVVHHGGAGTTAAGLVLGCPTVIIPFFGDQPFWGSIVARAGAGPKPIPYKELTTEKLTEAIKTALEPATKEKATELGERMRTEQGVRNAAVSFYRHLDLKSLQCSICPHLPAVWWVRHSHVKLSTFAAAVLVETGVIDPRNVVLYRSIEYDTNRDPRGPLTAGAEVLYGIVSGFVSGIADVPCGVATMFSTNQERRRRRRKEWEDARHLSHFDGASSLHRRTKSSLDSGVGEDNRLSHRDLQKVRYEANRPATSWNRSRRPSVESDEAYVSAEEGRLSDSDGESTDPDQGQESSPRSSSSSSQTTLDPDTDPAVGEELDLERTITRLRTREESGAKEFFGEATYHAGKMGKHILDWAITIPTDVTLSLSKGFHNAPKLYHDSTVEKTPKVLGVRSGFRAAGTEFTHGFYHGVTGLLTQPMLGMEKSGGKGFIKGVGKGVGGVLFKPAAGIWGLAGYPLDGIHKSLRNSLAKSKTKEILTSRIKQGIEEMSAATTQQRADVIRRWNELVKDEGTGESSSRGDTGDE
ncbi:putative UDP-glucose,sterol transferase [Aspergillus saccharolyticus JOP 1030-1]|uniref:UDP-glucose,sterol transferase n=1 Tax=Aspergillus saccharolyticus JOP 1030-1 TaxID=1450539 RepID=A0A318Z6U5_9EURO|nr:UDP-glucose,sterol transferase [Aspergillus saccharolyticus JOP 1030-1]PYH43031.1 UDP-glucose,sterol transferase [Aspergillus saccharolyticus JOP 1030-1]